MKSKFLLMITCILLLTGIKAQTLFQEKFDNGFNDWTPSGDFTQNWSVAKTNIAGGNSPELQFVGTYPQLNMNKMCRLLSPVIDVSAYPDSDLLLTFKQNLTRYGSTKIGVAVTTDNGDTWTDLWSTTSESPNKEFRKRIPHPATGDKNLQFCLFYSGDLRTLKVWSVDDIEVSLLPAIEINLQKIVFEKPQIKEKESTTISLTVNNFGQNNINSIEMWYQIGTQDPVAQIVTDLDIAAEMNKEITFLQNIEGLKAGTYNVKAWVSRVNGTEVSPAALSSELIVIPIASIKRMAMIEVFTSSTCGPCVDANKWLLPLVEKNAGNCVITKYQMNFPGSGDPYYTAECGTRSSYYKVSGVPTIFLDGAVAEKASDKLQAAITASNNKTNVEADITAAFQVSGKTVKIQISIIPHVTGSYRVYTNVDEKKTTGNVGSNGETEFHHVMMKMFPSGQGQTYDFVSGQPVSLTYEQDLSSTNIEEFNDLEVAVFIQDHSTKSILNAVFAANTTTALSLEPVKDLTVTQQEKNHLLKWTAPAGCSGYNIYRDGVKIASNVSGTTYEDKALAPEEYTYWVAAIYSGIESPYVWAKNSILLNIEAPSNVKVETTDFRKFTIKWIASATAGVTGYNVYREGTKINQTPVKETLYNDEVVYQGIYCYTVRSITDEGESLHSEKGCVEASIFPPENVKTFQVNISEKEVMITWNKVEDAEGYYIYRDNVRINTELHIATSFTDIAPEFAEYCYTVTAFSDGLESVKSSPPACVTLYDDVAIGQAASENRINLYPNPVGGTLHIDSEYSLECISIYDIYGKLVKEIKPAASSINIHDLTKGIYLFKVKASEGESVHKIIKR